MVGHTRSTTDDEQSTITRRRAVASVAAAGVGGIGLLTRGTDSASAQVTMGEFSVTGDEATLSRAPAAITIAAQGEWSVDAPGAVEQVMITLQAIVGSDGDERTADISTDRAFDSTSGAFDFSAGLLDSHPDVTGELFVPDAPGESKTTPIRVAVIVSPVQNGEVVTEARVEDTADVVVTRDGVEVRTGGSGSITVDATGSD